MALSCPWFTLKRQSITNRKTMSTYTFGNYLHMDIIHTPLVNTSEKLFSSADFNHDTCIFLYQDISYLA